MLINSQKKLLGKINKLYKSSTLHRNIFRKRIGLFISIPKNGSKSILRNFDLGTNRDSENTSSLIIFENHQLGKVLNQKYNLNDLFVFCFSRCPYDRTISWFEYHKNLKPYSELNFRDWLDKGMPHHWVQQNKTNFLLENKSPLEQHIFIEDCKVDFIGKIEDFENSQKIVKDELNKICSMENLKYRFNIQFNHINTSKRNKKIEGYYDARSKKIVSKLLSKDFDIFGYDK